MNEIELIEGLKNGKHETVKYFYEHYHDRFFKTLSSKGGAAEDIEDLFQDSIVDMIHNLKQDRFQGKSKLYSYFVSIAKFKFYKLLKDKNNLSYEVIDRDFEVEEDICDNIDKDMINKLVRLLSSIDEKCEALLKLYYYQGANLKDIATRLDLSYDFVRVKKKRCLNKLKEKFS